MRVPRQRRTCGRDARILASPSSLHHSDEVTDRLAGGSAFGASSSSPTVGFLRLRLRSCRRAVSIHDLGFQAHLLEIIEARVRNGDRVWCSFRRVSSFVCLAGRNELNFT
jgi:hypothetical protein